MDIKDTFRNIGFLEQEITIYLYLLQKGSATQQEISDNTQLLRQTVYDVMKKMQSKGYVALSKEGKTKLYSAVAPELLLHRLKERADSFENNIAEIKRIKKEKNEVYSESFIGMKGLKNLFDLSLEQKEPILWIANQNEHDATFNDFYWDNYAVKRIERKIHIKLLLETHGRFKTDKNTYREVRTSKIINKNDGSIAIFGDCAIMYTIKGENLFGVFVKNKKIANILIKMFSEMWKDAKIA